MALTTIGQLVHGDTIPSSQPRRYKTRAGYIKLRWKVGVRQYVEAYEHRVVCGLPDAHVHHINGNKTDNRIENLQVLPPKDHAGEHRDFDYAAAADMYRSGATTTKVGMAFGVSAGQVSRALRSIGVEMRQPSIPRRTVDLSRVRELHALGMRPARIAAALGETPAVVRRVCRDMGLPSFRPGAPKMTETVGWR